MLLHRCIVGEGNVTLVEKPKDDIAIVESYEWAMDSTSNFEATTKLSREKRNKEQERHFGL